MSGCVTATIDELLSRRQIAATGCEIVSIGSLCRQWAWDSALAGRRGRLRMESGLWGAPSLAFRNDLATHWPANR